MLHLVFLVCNFLNLSNYLLTSNSNTIIHAITKELDNNINNNNNNINNNNNNIIINYESRIKSGARIIFICYKNINLINLIKLI
jgi:hypothetical protein